MKNLFLVLVAVATLTACNKEERLYHKSIQGEWYFDHGYPNDNPSMNATPLNNKSLIITKDKYTDNDRTNADYEVVSDGMIRVSGTTLRLRVENSQAVLDNGTFTFKYNFVK